MIGQTDPRSLNHFYPLASKKLTEGSSMRKQLKVVTLAVVLGLLVFGPEAYAASNYTDILKEGLLGAGVGAISAGSSGGKAGQGALVGAGTSILGNVLLGILGGSPQTSGSQPSYSQPAYYSQPVYQTPVYQKQIYQTVQPVQVQTPQAVYYPQPEPIYTQPAPQTPVYYSYSQAPKQDYNRYILRQGLLGAGVGAISAEASGGKAGSGALIGAGTNVIGDSLLSFLTSGA